jgi:hypothetical protein
MIAARWCDTPARAPATIPVASTNTMIVFLLIAAPRFISMGAAEISEPSLKT